MYLPAYALWYPKSLLPVKVIDLSTASDFIIIIIFYLEFRLKIPDALTHNLERRLCSFVATEILTYIIVYSVTSLSPATQRRSLFLVI